MSSRAFITDGKRSIYLHYGLKDKTLKILNEYYSTPEKVKALLDMGYASVLGQSLVPPWIGYKFGDQHKSKELEKRFGERCGQYSVFLHRDKGEPFEVISGAINRKELDENDQLFVYNGHGGWYMAGTPDIIAIGRVLDNHKKLAGLVLSDGTQQVQLALNRCIAQAEKGIIKNIKAVTRGNITYLQGKGISLESLPYKTV
jgi:hypothetical protein